MLIGILIGFFVGTNFGVMLMCILQVGARSDREDEE